MNPLFISSKCLDCAIKFFHNLHPYKYLKPPFRADVSPLNPPKKKRPYNSTGFPRADFSLAINLLRIRIVSHKNFSQFRPAYKSTNLSNCKSCSRWSTKLFKTSQPGKFRLASSYLVSILINSQQFNSPAL